MSKPALHHAVLRSDAAEAERLLAGGAAPSEFDDLGCTPLHWAVFRGGYECAELLLRYRADVNAISDDGVSPLWRAEDFGLDNIAALLRSYGGKSIDDPALRWRK
jgi:ankyrin repeat protein